MHQSSDVPWSSIDRNRNGTHVALGAFLMNTKTRMDDRTQSGQSKNPHMGRTRDEERYGTQGDEGDACSSE